MFGRLLVPLDGMPRSEAVLPWVRALATRSHTVVYLVRVVPPAVELAGMGFGGFGPPPAPLSTPQEWAQAAQGARDYLRYVAEAALPGVRVRVLVREGEAAAEIARAAAEVAADLVVMATAGRSGLRRLLRGSVAAAVVRRAGRPVVLLGPRPAAPAAALPAPHPRPRPA